MYQQDETTSIERFYRDAAITCASDIFAPTTPVAVRLKCVDLTLHNQYSHTCHPCVSVRLSILVTYAIEVW